MDIHILKKSIYKWIHSQVTIEPKGIRDTKGNIINSPKDILVVNSSDTTTCTSLSELLKLAKSPADKDISPTGNRLSNGFYSSYTDKEGKIYNVFLSAYTHEVLPIHFSETTDRLILLFGNSGSGKSTYTTHLLGSMRTLLNFTNLDNTRTSKYRPAVSKFAFDQKYIHYNSDLMSVNTGYLPDPTHISENLQLFPMIYSANFEGRNTQCILRFIDIPGEYKGKVEDRIITGADSIWFILDGEECLTNYANTISALKEFDDLRETFPELRNTHTQVVITKADRIKDILYGETPEEKLDHKLVPFWHENREHFTKVFPTFPENSLKTKTLTASYHVPVFDPQIFKSSELFAKLFLQTFYSGYISFDEASYLMMSSLSEKPNENRLPENNFPYRIEEPLLRTMVHFNLYPIKNL